MGCRKLRFQKGLWSEKNLPGDLPGLAGSATWQPERRHLWGRWIDDLVVGAGILLPSGAGPPVRHGQR